MKSKPKKKPKGKKPKGKHLLKDNTAQTFTPSSLIYFRLVMSVLVIATMMVLLTIVLYQPELPVRAEGGFLILTFYPLGIIAILMSFWELNIFRLEAGALHVRKRFLFSIKHCLPLKDIHSIRLIKKAYSNTYYPMLVIYTQNRKKISFMFPLSQNAKLEFIQMLGTQNIPFQDYTNEESPWDDS